ncbi:unnamed protein product [Dicrocoelium dendriticum]|nr:unnamed protein product [Dicrocoelium dendriticum]
MTSGVPQGSVFGPELFKVNPAKSVFMSLGKGADGRTYTLDGQTLYPTPSVKDLGVLSRYDLKSVDNTNRLYRNGLRMLWALKRSFCTWSEEVATRLFSSIIRPMLEYGSPAYFPITRGEAQKIERVQHVATRLIPSLRGFGFEDRCEKLGLYTLSYRRVRVDLIMTYRILHLGLVFPLQVPGGGIMTAARDSYITMRVRPSQSIVKSIVRVHASHFSKRAEQRKKIRDNSEYDISSQNSWSGLQSFVFGYSATGALGIERLVVPKDSTPPVYGLYHPVRVPELKNPIKVACGYGFTTYISKFSSTNYSVYGCGINSDGQLGQHRGLSGDLQVGKPVHVLPTPQPIDLPLSKEESELFYPSHIACGRAHTVIGMQPRTDSRSFALARPFLLTLGNNALGQCGRQVEEDEIYGPETAVTGRIQLPAEVTGLQQICCGQDHTLLVTTDGVVYSTGLGSDGQTGLGHFEITDQFQPVRNILQGVRVVQVASSGDTVLALSECGRLFAWGNNEYGQIWPASEDLQVCNPVELPLEPCVVPEETGLDSNDVKSIGRICSIACAGSMCSVLNEDGHVFVWGFGCLGLGPLTTVAPLPTLIPPGIFVPALPSTPQRLVSIYAGLHHFIARSSGGLLWAWGAPRGGLYCLGLGRRTEKNATRQTYPFMLEIPAIATQVACGVDHSIVLAKSAS